MHVPPAWRRWLVRLGLAALIALSIAIVPARFFADEGPAAQLEREADELRREIAAMREQKRQLVREVHALSTDVRAIEALARDELGLAYVGERIIKLMPEAQVASASARPLAPTPPGMVAP